MRAAPKVIFLVRDAQGFGPSISRALQPTPDSNLSRSESSFEPSLEKYGIADRCPAVDLVQFLDPHGSPQVSIFLLPNYKPHVAACAVNEVLASISSENVSTQPTIIIPFIMKSLETNREMMNGTVAELEVTLYGAEIGATNEFTHAMIAGTSAPPPLQTHCEPLACLLQMTRALSLPTVFIIASSGLGHFKRSTGYEFQALLAVGQFLANHVGLCFLKERLQLEHVEKPKVTQEPWQALYG